jgi:hypothetical protein
LKFYSGEPWTVEVDVDADVTGGVDADVTGAEPTAVRPFRIVEQGCVT